MLAKVRDVGKAILKSFIKDMSKMLLANLPGTQSHPSLFLALQNSLGSRSASGASLSNLHTSLVCCFGVGEHSGWLKNSLHHLDRSLVGTTG